MNYRIKSFALGMVVGVILTTIQARGVISRFDTHFLAHLLTDQHSELAGLEAAQRADAKLD